METIWNLMHMFVVIFELMGLGTLVIVLFVGIGCNGKIDNKIMQIAYDLIIGGMFDDETLE